MQFESKVFCGTIQKRYKRFLADITLDDGQEITAHTPNTGSMKSCWEKGWNVLVTYKDDPKRKLKYTLEMTHNGESWIGVNTSRPNKIVKEAIESGKIPELDQFDSIRPEYKVGNSRIDLMLEKNGEKTFIEIKNVTLQDQTLELFANRNVALFPDAVSTRGQKHLKELTRLRQEGHRCCMFYLVQRQDCELFAPAWSIDPTYSELLVEAHEQGVEILVYQCQLSENGIEIESKLPFNLNQF